MSRKYFIPNLPFIRNHLNRESKSLVVKGSRNLVEFGTDEDIRKFLESIKKAEFVNDEKLLDNIKRYLPGAEKFFSELPIANSEIMDAFMFIFNDYPPDLQDEDNALKGFSKFLNHTVRKKEFEFIVDNIKNGSLAYDERWKHKKFQDFYFLMKKTVHNLDTYYSFFSRSQYLLRDTALRELAFNDDTIGDRKEEMMNKTFNICGNNFLDLKQRLQHMRNQIVENRRVLKRTNIVRSFPKKYAQQEKQALMKIDGTIHDIEERIKECDETKKRLREEIKRRHGFFSKHTLKKIFREFKWTRPFFRK